MTQVRPNFFVYCRECAGEIANLGKVNRRLWLLHPPPFPGFSCLFTFPPFLFFLWRDVSEMRVLWKAASPCLKTHNSVWYCNWLVKTGHVGCLVLSSSLYLLLSVWWLQLQLVVGHVRPTQAGGAQKAANSQIHRFLSSCFTIFCTAGTLCTEESCHV